jgi:hypothetical protein
MKYLITAMLALALAFTVPTPSHADALTPVSVPAPAAAARPVQFAIVALDQAHADALMTAYAAQPQTQAGLNAAVLTIATLPSGYTLVFSSFNISGSSKTLSVGLKSTSPVTTQ